MNAFTLIMQERQRQIKEEGLTPEHDDEHSAGELAQAAEVYRSADSEASSEPPPEWPWRPGWYKPASRLRNLVKAGALYQAELDRLERLRRETHRRLLAVMVETDTILIGEKIKETDAKS